VIVNKNMAGENMELEMNKELIELLEKSRSVKMTPIDLEEHRIALATANGSFSDARVTIETMKAGVTILAASEKAAT
jgi:hypothetical protein